MKILILDPDWRFAQQARDYLESHAHLVVHMTTAELADDKLNSWNPDLVIVAAELCENNGLIRDIHKHDTAVLLTGWMDRYDLLWQTWQKGGHELMMKPMFNIDELYQSMVLALENATAGITQTRRAASA